MAHDASQNNPKKEIAFALVGITAFLVMILGIGISGFLRPAGNHEVATVPATEAGKKLEEALKAIEKPKVEEGEATTTAETTSNTAEGAKADTTTETEGAKTEGDADNAKTTAEPAPAEGTAEATAKATADTTKEESASAEGETAKTE